MCATGFTISSGEVQLNNWFCVNDCPAGLLHPEGMMVGRIYPAPHMEGVPSKTGLTTLLPIAPCPGLTYWLLVTFEVYLEESAGSVWSCVTSCRSLETDVTQSFFRGLR